MGGSSPDAIEVTKTEDTEQTSEQESRSSENLRRTFPSGEAQRLSEDAFGTQRDVLGNLTSLGQGNLTAGLPPDLLAAIQQLGNFGQNPAFTTAFKTLEDAAGGAGTFGTPEYLATIEAAQRASLPGLIGPGGFRAGSAHLGASLGEAGIQAGLKFSDARRQEQLQAAQILPSIGMLPIEALLRGGGISQQQAQNEINAPINFQNQLGAMAQGFAPLQNFLGSSVEGTSLGTGTENLTGSAVKSQPLFEDEVGKIAGGALQGAGIGATFGPIGAGIGAVGGGLLGAFV